MSEEQLLDDQVNYYRARAPEYDEWHRREGRYDRGADHRRRWLAELEEVRQALASHGPLGNVLELACGTGLWTRTLAEHSTSLRAVDAVPETIEINRRKNAEHAIDYQVADIFNWRPDRQFDFIFFGFWLSHVPDSRFDSFWNQVANALHPGGRVFFVDSLKTDTSTAMDHQATDHSGVVERRLNDGRAFQIVKHFYTPEPLLKRLNGLGWSGTVTSTNEFFLLGQLEAHRQTSPEFGSSAPSTRI